MSIVRYTNKKTGVVSLYESTSCYDPVTKQSRPKRKYLGIEDPQTGELIPSTKQRGRKKDDPQEAKPLQETPAGSRIAELSESLKKSNARVRELEKENKELRDVLLKLRKIVNECIVPDADPDPAR